MTLDELAAAQPYARPLKVPDWTLGCWRRRSITFADGAYDDTTEVWWLQSRGLTGDIRIPATRPDLSHRAGLDACTREELACLGGSEGGVADTHWDGALMRWTDWSAFQPLNNWPEPGDLRRVGECMIEFAPSGAYVEDWRFQSSGASLRVGLRLVGVAVGDGPISRRAGGLVVVGDLAILSLGRRQPLPGRPLGDLLREGHVPPETVFDAVTSFAHRRRETFQVSRSTNPFLEGLPLQLGDFAIASPGVVVEILGPIRRHWQVDALST